MHVLPLAPLRWRIRDCTSRTWLPASVPGCVHLDLIRAKQIPDPFWSTHEVGLQWIEERDWEYRTEFTAPAELLDAENLELVADGLDTVATVTLNGKRVATSDNMFVQHRWAVKRWLRRGRNQLTIRFDSAMRYIRTHRTNHAPREFNDPVGRCQVIRKQQCQFGWDWGPRFVTAGIWRDLRLEGWSENRLESVRVTQHHAADGTVALQLEPELTRREAGVACRWELAFGGMKVAAGRGTRIAIEHPQLWWPNGHGSQPLYDLHVEVSRADGSVIGQWDRRIGLRTIQLERQPDQWGESFRFVVNGRRIFAKGANWIPAHSFVAGLSRDAYERDLRHAAAANMNMVRVWGGGIYESEDFYDVCDELGLLVWQDFMFACSIYPADREFLASIRTEAEQQIRRIRHRACLALWCGNNEIEQLNPDLLKQPRLRRNYDAIFHRTLPDAVARRDGVTPYWPSSQYRPNGDNTHPTGEFRGDTHYWDVWHARHPVKDYEKWKFRFVSEFGMQSYSSPATNATFCPPGRTNVFGPEMENHQKNRAGNQIILDYVSRRYRFPKSQDDLIYLSQLNQAYCMQTGVEHYRRLMPRCMGALYWQLNDCWPVASWSSIEFTGRWKALHYLARRFFAPALVSAEVPGDETTIIGNYRRSTVREVHLYTVYDAPQPAQGTLRWDVFHLDGWVISRGQKSVALRYGESVRQKTVDLGPILKQHGRDTVYLRIALEIGGERVSEETVFLAPPRFLELPAAPIDVAVDRVDGNVATLTFASPVFQHRVAFDVPGQSYTASDNFFDLYPGERKRVSIRLTRPLPASRLRRSITVKSLADTYER